MSWHKKNNIEKIFRKDILLIAFAFLIAIIIRLLRPIVHIRIARWDMGTRVGHLACESDIYLAEKKWGISRNRPDNIFYLYYIPGAISGLRPLIPNQCLFSHVKKKFPGLRYPRILAFVDLFNTKFFREPSAQAFDTAAHIDKYVLTPRTPPPFVISRKDVRIAKKGIQSLGIDDNKPILLFFNRDSSYIKKYLKGNNDKVNNFRNSLISSYLPMASSFVQSGYSCVRMGAETEEKVSGYPGIIDFSSYPRDELAELYLFSVAKFSVSDMTGINIFPALFRKPRVMVNVASLLTFYDDDFFHPMFDSIIIFKKHWCMLEDRLLSASEIAKKGLLQVYDNNEYIKNNVELINNTPEEIQEAALEMHLRLNNEWTDTEEDLILQHRFWKNLDVKRDSRLISLYPRVGTHFLRNNDWLLS